MRDDVEGQRPRLNVEALCERVRASRWRGVLGINIFIFLSALTEPRIVATELVQESEPGYEPWFASVFSPSSKEVESGLFALQAALGGGGGERATGQRARRRGTR